MTEPTPEQVEAAAIALWKISPITEPRVGVLSFEESSRAFKARAHAALVAAAGVTPQSEYFRGYNQGLLDVGMAMQASIDAGELPGTAAPVQVDEAKLAAFLATETHAPSDTHDNFGGACTECPWPVHELPPAELAAAVAEWLRGGGQ